jgi:hypothetical protein
MKKNFIWSAFGIATILNSASAAPAPTALTGSLESSLPESTVNEDSHRDSATSPQESVRQYLKDRYGDESVQEFNLWLQKNLGDQTKIELPKSDTGRQFSTQGL